MSELNKDVTEAIKKNLPSAVADELKAYIIQADKNKILLDRAETSHEELSRINENLNKENKRMRDELVSLKARESEFLASEDKVRTATLETAVSKAKLEGAMEVTRLVFANNIVKTNAFGSVPIITHPPGGYPMVGSGGTSEQRTVEG